MEEMIFRLTVEELEVLQSLIQFVDGDIPDWMNEDAYDSLFNKVMSN
jgi:succinate dehydrogenase flavin-adding protein (antitoxin of CptAB toxin-antitoxin module)